jgi:pimeloyl-ACP methyl ester carboxylesterase
MLRVIAILSALAFGPVTLAGVPAAHAAMVTRPAPATTEVKAAVPVIAWHDFDGSKCARVIVPLDYDDPTGAMTALHLLKVPAAVPSRRIGTLFVNPGGPGATATDFARFFPFLVRPAIHNRFDIVGVDPRGTSSPISICRSEKPEPAYPSVAFPVTTKQIAGWIRHDKWQRSACRNGPNPITNHLTTADTARDMDLIRRAVGDDKLTYYGISYGTYLGATYGTAQPRR